MTAQKKRRLSLPALFCLLLLSLYLVRTAFFPLLSLAGQLLVLYRALYLISEGINRFCPVFAFGVAYRAGRDSWGRCYAFYGIYALTELLFQVLYTLLTGADEAAIFYTLLSVLLGYLVFQATAVLMITVLLIAAEHTSLSNRLFSLRDRDTLALLVFSTLLFLYYIVAQSLELKAVWDRNLYLEDADILAFVLSLVGLCVTMLAAVPLTRLFAVRQDPLPADWHPKETKRRA